MATTIRLSARTTANQISGLGIDGKKCLNRNHAGQSNRMVARSMIRLCVEGKRLFRKPVRTSEINIRAEVIVPTIDEMAVCPKP